MGLGNGNAKSGNKGSNHSFEHRLLLAIAAGGGAPPPGGYATEPTLVSILNSIMNSQDFEVLLVRDTGNADLVVQQIREYDQGTGLWTTSYEDVSGAPYVPVGPLEYLDPSAILSLMLTELINIKSNTQPNLLQGCAHIDLSNSTGTFGTGSSSFAIVIESGTAVIGGLTRTAPYGVSFGSDSNGTLGGISYDATVDLTAVVTATRVQ